MNLHKGNTLNTYHFPNITILQSYPKTNQNMRKRALLITIITLLQFSNLLTAQVQGKWHGKLIMNPTSSLTIAFEIKQHENGKFIALMHSVDQKAFNIEVDSVIVADNSIKIALSSLRADYQGSFKSDKEIAGSMIFSKTTKMELNLTRVEEFPFKVAGRPQEPKEPLPYISEDVVFENKADNIKLAGTLTIPDKKGKYPAVVLISGSGPSDRNQTIFGHKTFLVLSDMLTRAGFAVLRYDDRGAGESEGVFINTTNKEHAADASAAAEFLKTMPFIDAGKVGLLGHSLGADIAPVAASINRSLSFVILMAGSASPLTEDIVEQYDAIYPAMGVSKAGTDLNRDILYKMFEIIKEADNITIAKERAIKALEEFEPRAALLSAEDKKMLGYRTPLNINSWRDFFAPHMKHDLFHKNADYFSKVKCPVLVLGGEKDLQVLPRHVNLIKEGLEKGGNKKVTAILYPGKNHLMQDAATGELSEYGEIENTIAPDVVADIVNWIKNL